MRPITGQPPGPASAACQWVTQGREYQAIGVDIDPSVLEWGRENRVGQLAAEEQARLEAEAKAAAEEAAAAEAEAPAEEAPAEEAPAEEATA